MATDHDFVIHPCPRLVAPTPFLEGRRDTQDFSARGSWGLQLPVGGAWRCQCPGTPSLQPWGTTVSRQEATTGVAPSAGPGGRPRGCVHRPAHQPGRQWTAASLAFILLLGRGRDLPACLGTVHLGGLSHFSTRPETWQFREPCGWLCPTGPGSPTQQVPPYGETELTAGPACKGGRGGRKQMQPGLQVCSGGWLQFLLRLQVLGT